MMLQQTNNFKQRALATKSVDNAARSLDVFLQGIQFQYGLVCSVCLVISSRSPFCFFNFGIVDAAVNIFYLMP